MMKSIVAILKRKWYILLLLIPSTIVAFIISTICGFYIANLYHSDYLGIEIGKLIFAIIAPLPMIVYWKNIFEVTKKKVIGVMFFILVQVLLIGLFWLLINSF